MTVAPKPRGAIATLGGFGRYCDLSATSPKRIKIMAKLKQFEGVVIGAGPAGLATGIAMAHFGLNCAVVGPKADPKDGRTAALFQGSVALLKRTGVWSAIAPAATAIEAIRLIDATGSLFRAPEVLFRACEIGEDSFGFNVRNSDLTAALEGVAQSKLTRIETAGVTGIAPGAHEIRVSTSEGHEITAALLAGADGRNSLARTSAGIATQSWSYPQSAVVCTFEHSRPHNGVSTEFHRRAGPLTTVPMPGNTSSLVWVEQPPEAERLTKLADEAFLSELSGHLGGLLGALSGASTRRSFPLSGLTAESYGANRIALVGEAAHVIPPIGAQGLNLSLRDAATLAELVGAARNRGEDIGISGVLAAYESRRRPDARNRIWTIDALNRTLLSEYLPVHLARGAGLFAIGQIGPLRRYLMREGIAPSNAAPELMRAHTGLSTSMSSST